MVAPEARCCGKKLIFIVGVALMLVSRNVVAANTPPSFRADVMAILSKSGCNLGTCHGSANGKGGLKLSLRGQDPDIDFVTLTRQFSSRRVNVMVPAKSLLLQKPLMGVPHEGGRRFDEASAEYQTLKTWIEFGLPDDPADTPVVVGLEVSPTLKTVEVGSEPVQISATAHFSDGTSRDVTNLCVFDSSSLDIHVSRDGKVAVDTIGLTTVTVRYLHVQHAIRLEVIPAWPDFEFRAPVSTGFIDELVFGQLRRLRINPSPVCDDAVFLRRAWLDATGQLPPPDIAREFMASTDHHKRAAMIDRLLSSEEFVDQQTMHWADLLRVEEKTLDATGLKEYHQWIRASIAEGKPLNRMAAELIEARGSTYKVPQANLYRALRSPEERGEAMAQLFLGVRLTCAKCHNHPFDRWTQDDYYGWSGLFARVDYEIVENKRRDKNDKHEFVGEQIVRIAETGEVRNPRTGQPAALRFLGDSEVGVTETAEQDRLQSLAAWISDPGNHRFAATQANRIWFQLMGRGIVDPVDDFRATNPPINAELLQSLTEELVRSNFDMRHLMRLIMNSSTYQLSSEADASNIRDDKCFSHVIPQRLTAEQILDAVSVVLGSPVTYGGHAAGTKAHQLIGVRNGGFRFAKPESGDNFLKLFGRPNRLQSCECERSNDPNLSQTFEMIGGDLIAELLRRPDNRIAQAFNSDQTPEEFLNDLYWAALSRAPMPAESAALMEYIQARADHKAAFEDVLWGVLNSNEFLLRR
ncbi:MAG: DUF1553 domain-containing protein [Planctomycetaceae bacterium]|nr:DUF1553 domain-containing protein [Planctomycetaceae bacterium]